MANGNPSVTGGLFLTEELSSVGGTLIGAVSARRVLTYPMMGAPGPAWLAPCSFCLSYL
jgi:hypothetical protein